MGKIEKISISLPKDMVESVNAAVDSGDYATTSEVVRDALRKWESDRAYDQAVKTYGLERLKAMVQEGIESLDSGKGIPADQVFDRLEAKYKAMAEARRKPGESKKAKRR